MLNMFLVKQLAFFGTQKTEHEDTSIFKASETYAHVRAQERFQELEF